MADATSLTQSGIRMGRIGASGTLELARVVDHGMEASFMILVLVAMKIGITAMLMTTEGLDVVHIRRQGASHLRLRVNRTTLKC